MRAVKEAAGALGNTPATCRKYYIHPAILDAWRDGKIGASSGPGSRRKYLSPDEVETLGILRHAKRHVRRKPAFQSLRSYQPLESPLPFQRVRVYLNNKSQTV